MSTAGDVGGVVWNVIQQAQIERLDNTTDGLRENLAQQQADTQAAKHLEERVAYLALISRALFELLQEKSGVTERELAAKITEVDLRDGKADGRMTPQPKKCPSCQSMMAPRFNRCLFCGYRDQTADPFNTVK
jgi:hypothetical protein